MKLLFLVLFGSLLMAPPLFAEKYRLRDIPKESEYDSDPKREKSSQPQSRTSPSTKRTEKFRLRELPHPDPDQVNGMPKNKKKRKTPEQRQVEIEKYVRAFYSKGKKALREGDLGQAEGFFDRVLILRPNHRGAKDGIEEIMKAYEISEPLVETEKKELSLVEKLQSDLDEAYKSKRWYEARSLAKKILALEPDHAYAKKKVSLLNHHFYLNARKKGEDREKRGDLEEALEFYRVALNYRSDPALKEKINLIKTNLSLRKSDRSEETYLLALTASQQGKYKEALLLCETALTLNPDNIQAKRMRERLKSKIR